MQIWQKARACLQIHAYLDDIYQTLLFRPLNFDSNEKKKQQAFFIRNLHK